MRKYVLILGLMLFLSNGLAMAEDKFSYGGYLKNEMSAGSDHHNRQFSKFKDIVQLSGQYQLNDEVALFASGRYWYDSVYGWYGRYDKAQVTMQHTQRTDWLRDCYLDYIQGPWFLRLGKQQVAWGQADGIAVLDRVNPVDLTEYWLQDMVDLRIPLWMANINYSPKLNSNLQFLLIPDFEQSTAAPPGAPFVFRSYSLYDTWKKGKNVDENIIYPGKKFKNSTFGLQWKDRIGDWEYTLNYLYGYYYSARTYTRIYNPFGNKYAFDREFKKWRVYGGSFNKTVTNPGILEGITFRGDFAYYNHEPTYYGVDGSSTGYQLWNNVFWLIGIDRYVFTKLQASFQFAQYIMQDAKSGFSGKYPLNAYTYGLADQVENIFSFKLSASFINDRLKPEFFISCTDDNQGRISPKISYEIKDNLVLTVGVHHFYGHVQDSNGQFRNSDQIYTNLKFSF